MVNEINGFDIISNYQNSEILIAQGGDGHQLAVFESNRTVEEFMDWFINESEYQQVKSILEEEYIRELMPEDFIDFLTDERWYFNDEVFMCNECGKVYPVYMDSIYYTPNYMGDGFIICQRCVKESKSITEDYIQSIVNNPRKANIIFTESELQRLGFQKVNVDPYENGYYYGQNDNPKRIYENNKSPDKELLFSIVRDGNVFQTLFDLYRR